MRSECPAPRVKVSEIARACLTATGNACCKLDVTIAQSTEEVVATLNATLQGASCFVLFRFRASRVSLTEH